MKAELKVGDKVETTPRRPFMEPLVFTIERFSMVSGQKLACGFYWLARVVSFFVVEWVWSRANSQPKKSGKEDSKAKADKKTSEKQEHRSEKPKMTERRSS